MSPCAGRKGDSSRLLVLSLQTTPKWLPEVFFVNSPTLSRIACRRCQEESKPKGTASVFPSTSWACAHTVFTGDKLRPLLKTKPDSPPHLLPRADPFLFMVSGNPGFFANDWNQFYFLKKNLKNFKVTSIKPLKKKKRERERIPLPSQMLTLWILEVVLEEKCLPPYFQVTFS